jgi:curved DNA-binding protein CbpA
LLAGVVAAIGGYLYKNGKRKEEEERREAQRRAEEKVRAAEARAQEERRREEERREAQRRAEDARRAAEARAQEERRRDEENRKAYRTIEDLQRLSGDEFERLVASLFAKDGYRVLRRGGSGDEGIDLILEIAGARDAVQCKRWKTDIGSAVIREFYGSIIHMGARYGFVITTAAFSASARQFAAGKPIRLVDGRDFLSWINGSRNSGAWSSAQPNGNFSPYDLLGVSRNASKDDIRKAYLRLIAKYHPDKVAHLGDEFQQIAKDKTREIIAAYQALANSR